MKKESAKIVCGQCNQEVLFTNPVETGMKLALEAGGYKNVPGSVCESCFDILKGKVSEGARMRADQIVAEEDFKEAWAARLNMIKLARYNMKEKNFPEALMSYKQYMTLLETTFGLSTGELIPEKVKAKERAKEFTIIATALWDMLQIYDMHANYKAELTPTLRKLKLFLPYSTVYKKVVNAAIRYHKQANNPEVFAELIKDSQKAKGACFVATAAYEGEPHYTVSRLREWREQDLKKSVWGRRFIYFYYKYSPILARYIAQRESLKKFFRKILYKFVLFLDMIKK